MPVSAGAGALHTDPAGTRAKFTVSIKLKNKTENGEDGMKRREYRSAEPVVRNATRVRLAPDRIHWIRV